MVNVEWNSHWNLDWKLGLKQLKETCKRVGIHEGVDHLETLWEEGVDPLLQLEADAPTSGYLPFSSAICNIR